MLPLFILFDELTAAFLHCPFSFVGHIDPSICFLIVIKVTPVPQMTKTCQQRDCQGNHFKQLPYDCTLLYISRY